MSKTGYFGVFALMALENVFPPIPSELIMPLAGFTAARGELNFIAVLVAGTAGSVIGALPWYYAGKFYGTGRLKRLASRYGRWLTVTPVDIDKALHNFDKHGRKAVFFGRLIPAIRTLVSVPAGIGAMPLMPFLAYSTLGSLIWTGLLCAAGYILESNYMTVAKYLDPASKCILGFILVVYLFRVINHPGKKSK
jgi:membrane protein DedA with SNARE-associated domain